MQRAYLLIYSILLMTISFFSCAHSKQNPSEAILRWGDGGGFSGKETIYTLWPDGKVEQNGVFLGRLKKAEIKQIKENLRVLGLETMEFNEPGNMYQLIEIPVSGKTNKLVWDPFNEAHPKPLTLFYQHLKHIQNKITQ